MILKSCTVTYIKTPLHQWWKQLVVPSPVFKGGNASQRYTPWDKSITSWTAPSPKLVWHLNPIGKSFSQPFLGGFYVSLLGGSCLWFASKTYKASKEPSTPQQFLLFAVPLAGTPSPGLTFGHFRRGISSCKAPGFLLMPRCLNFRSEGVIELPQMRES